MKGRASWQAQSMTDQHRSTSVLEAIRGRRSIPKMKPDPLPHELVMRLLDAAVWSPNHRLTEPWQYFVLGSARGQRDWEPIFGRAQSGTPPGCGSS